MRVHFPILSRDISIAGEGQANSARRPIERRRYYLSKIFEKWLFKWYLVIDYRNNLFEQVNRDIPLISCRMNSFFVSLLALRVMNGTG